MKNLLLNKETVEKKEADYDHSFNLIEILTLSAISILIALSVWYTYPDRGLSIGLDAWKHFVEIHNYAVTTGMRPCNEMGFYFQGAIIYLLSSPSIGVFQTATALLSIIVVIAFYAVAVEYLKEIDRKLPILATVFGTLFSGFGWTYFIQNKLEFNSYSQLNWLYRAVFHSYWDISRSATTWLWITYRPLTIGTIFLFMFLLLLKQNNIEKAPYILITTLLIFTLALTHLPELIIIINFLTLFSLFVPRLKVRFIETLMGTALGTLLFTGFNIFFPIISMKILIIMITAISVAFVLNYYSQKKVYLSLAKYWKSFKIRKRGVSLLISLYLGFLFTCVLHREFFTESLVRNSGLVPWLLYPLQLGVVGLLALPALNISKHYSKNSFILIVFFLFSTLLLGRFISFLNLHIFHTGYSERRLVPFIFSAMSMLASITLNEAWKKIENVKMKHGSVKKFGIIILISFVVMIGIPSTFLTIEFWRLDLNNRKAVGTLIDEDKLDALYYLYDLSPKIIWSTSSQSYQQIIFVREALQPLQITKHLLSAIYPEQALKILYHLDWSPAYIYFSNEDLHVLNEKYEDSYLTQHIIKYNPKIYENPQITILKVQGTPPVSKSDVALIVPHNKDMVDYYFIIDALSLGNYNYTIVLDQDMNLDANVILIPMDNAKTDLITYLNMNSTKKIIIFNTNGYGPLANLFFQAESLILVVTNSTDLSLRARSTNEITLSKLMDAEGNERELMMDLEALPLHTKENVESLAWYTNERGSRIPFAVQTTLQDKEITYFNVYPLIKKIYDSNSTYLDPHIFGEIFNLAHIDLPKYVRVNRWIAVDDIFAFKKGFLTGNIKVQSSSIFLQHLNNPVEVSIKTIEEKGSLDNIFSLNVKGIRNVSIFTRSLNISSGRGFYTIATVKNSRIILDGNNVTLSLKLLNGTIKEIKYDSTGEIEINGSHILYLRDPRFDINGKASFEEAYAWHSIRDSFEKSKLHYSPQGNDVTIEGNINFNMAISDTFSITIPSSFIWEGHVEGPPLTQWNGLMKFMETFSLITWFIIIFVFWVYDNLHLILTR